MRTASRMVLLLIVGSVTTWTASCHLFDTDIRDWSGPSLALELQPSVIEFPGDGSQTINAHLTNTGTQPVTILLPGDGSESGWRTPILSWCPPPPRFGRCGNRNTVRASDFVELQPGQSVRLEYLGFLNIDKPGTYHMCLVLKNDPTMEWGGLAFGPERKSKKRARQTPAYRVISNTIEIRITSPLHDDP